MNKDMRERYKENDFDVAQIPDEWKKAELKLQLEWSLCYQQRKDIETCKIISDPEEENHIILIRPEVFNNLDLYRIDVFHELCHAKLSEVVSPAFSTLYFKKECGKLDGEAKKEFQRMAQMLYLAWAHVDIWVNDLRHENWPELTRQDIESFRKNVEKLSVGNFPEILGNLQTIIGIAINKAETNRHFSHSKKKPKPLNMNFLDRKTMDLINKLAKYYETLPKLKMEESEDIAMLENSVQKVVNIFGFPIKPTLTREDSRSVWSFEK